MRIPGKIQQEAVSVLTQLFCLIKELVHLSKKITQFDVPPPFEGQFAQYLVNLYYRFSKSSEINLFL